MTPDTFNMEILMRVQAAVALAVLMTGRVQAQTTINPLAQTGVSGFAASQITVLYGFEGEALRAISWSELYDQPCLLAITTSFPSGSNPNQKEMNICDGDVDGGIIPIATARTTASWKTVQFANHPRYYIRGVAVCKSSNDNNRIKGIRIYPAKVWTTARAIEVINEPDAATRINCGNWDSPTFCPSNYIAVELMVYHRPHQITGLGLKCRQVEY